MLIFYIYQNSGCLRKIYMYIYILYLIYLDEVYAGDGTREPNGEDWSVHPICLPPPGPLTWRDISDQGDR